MRASAEPGPGRVAGGAGRQPEPIRPDRASASRQGEARPRARGHVGAALSQPRPVRPLCEAPLPTASDVQQPQEPPAAPYFTSWVRPQIVHALEREGVPRNVAQYQAYYGGLKIKLTINLQLQQAAQRVIDAEFPPGSGGPTASLVAIDNSTGEVRAMVSGDERLPTIAIQPRHPRLPAARLGIQALHARGGDRERAVRARFGDRFSSR